MHLHDIQLLSVEVLTCEEIAPVEGWYHVCFQELCCLRPGVPPPVARGATVTKAVVHSMFIHTVPQVSMKKVVLLFAGDCFVTYACILVSGEDVCMHRLLEDSPFQRSQYLAPTR
jgi:hypothetical protein